MSYQDQSVDVVLAPIDCIRCNAVFGLTKEANRRYRKNNATFHCPYCRHPMAYLEESAEKRLQREFQRERQRRDQMQADRDFHKRSRAAIQGQLTKTKNRIKNGVCPCCHRYFKNLHRHVQGQHPGYHEEIIDKR